MCDKVQELDCEICLKVENLEADNFANQNKINELETKLKNYNVLVEKSDRIGVLKRENFKLKECISMMLPDCEFEGGWCYEPVLCSTCRKVYKFKEELGLEG